MPLWGTMRGLGGWTSRAGAPGLEVDEYGAFTGKVGLDVLGSDGWEWEEGERGGGKEV